MANPSSNTAPQVARKSVAVAGNSVKLSYLEAGSGPRTLVLVHGWSQSAEQFRFQIEALASDYRVIAFDLRGHGESDKPRHGYRIQRLARDLHEALAALNLKDATILGHSMGCSVLWCYVDTYGPDRISRFVFCDQASFLTTDARWTEQEVAQYGSIFTPETVSATAAALAGADGVAASTGFLKSMVTESMPPEQFQWMVDLNMKLPRSAAADLLYNHCHQDWRDVLPRIDRPTLFIGGKASLVPASCIEWAATQVPGARAAIFQASELGSHFMFVENPKKFNALLREFMG